MTGFETAAEQPVVGRPGGEQARRNREQQPTEEGPAERAHRRHPAHLIIDRVHDDLHHPRSMIPHHSGAILMCEEAPIHDPEIKVLCEGIVKSQAEEIALMEAMLEW